MANCRFCGNWGLFMGGRSGLCSRCDPLIKMAIDRHIQIIMESANIVNTTKKSETAISRFSVILDQINKLIEYEKKGIVLSSPLPTVVLANTMPQKDKGIFGAIEREWDDVQNRIQELKTDKAKLAKKEKFIEKISGYREEFSNPKTLDDFLMTLG